MLRSLDHHVGIREQYNGESCDILIALHARKSASAIQRFRREHPRKPLLVALTGTDLYRDIRTSKSAQRSLELATRLLLLQPDGRNALPRRLRGKTRVVFQSATAPRRKPRPLADVFEVCVSGHLRAVKDPFRAALAARSLPHDSLVRVTHVGAALSPEMEARARAEMQRNPRYHWLGAVPRWKAVQLVARSRLLVLTSKLEGGANVISEALAADVPILSTKISGSIGLLGANYQGYFNVGDTEQLAALLLRCESDTAFYRRLRHHCRRRSALVTPAHERGMWRKVIREVTANSLQYRTR
jgi:putative glycosyltransferase (TIGR04348 family)